MIGWKTCNDDQWVTAYSGYLMTVVDSNQSSLSSETICMDTSTFFAQGYGAAIQGPRLTYVKSGTGLWLDDKLIPCAVCVKVAPR